MSAVDPTRVRLGRIRCLTTVIECMKKGEALPPAVCFVPKEVKFEFSDGKETLNVLEEPKDGAKVLNKLPERETTKFTCSGQPVYNSAGGWMKMVSPHKGWVLLNPLTKAIKGKIKMAAASSKDEKKDPSNWLKAVEQMSTLKIGKSVQLSNADEEAMAELQTPPPGWNLEADEELAQFLIEHVINVDISQGGGVQGSEHFSRIQASSNEEALEELMDSDLEDNYWESDGNQGDHWLRFHMKPGTIIDKFTLLVDPDDSSYLPRRVVIKVGSQGSMSTLTTRNFSSSDYDTKELQLFLTPLTVHYDIIEVHVKSCYQGGIDTRIRGISVTTRTSESVILDAEALSKDVFTPERIARYPKLQPFEPKQLFHRGLILKRAAYLLDIDHNYLLPRSQLTTSKLDLVQVIRQLWPLCKKRNGLIQQLLSDSATSPPSRPTVYINRMAAKEHLEDPSKDPESKKTIFNQLMRELKKHTKPHNFNFRWAGSWTQWWECKFIQEGMIDQGGGFRDTLSEIAEELCPSNPDSEVALPLFIRSPNQSQDSSNVYRDAYIPNPSCTQFARYEFVGKLMGAMLRSHESLVLSLPQFVWKQLVGDSVTWARDFISVDSAEVKFINSIETMSREVFEASFEGALKFTTVLSNGKTISLVPGEDGDKKLVSFDSRNEYCKLAKESRMNESKEQIKAIKDGLTKVVPTEVLNLLTWQELETKVCGNPEISVDALKKSARYDSMLNENSPRVKVMWDALEKFNNDDRSRFLRFITGRRRLPCTIFIDSAEGSSKLPTSATCSNVLYLPKYDNVDEAVDRLKYAAYNCVAIDTDMTPSEWD